MEFEKNYTLEGVDKAKAMEYLTLYFKMKNFMIKEKNDSKLSVNFQSVFATKKEAILAASGLDIFLDEEFGKLKIHVKANLANADKLFKILSRMIGFMAIFFVVLFYIIFSVQNKGEDGQGTMVLGIVGLTFVPWIFLFPFMKKMTMKRFETELDTLVNNLKFED